MAGPGNSAAVGIRAADTALNPPTPASAIGSTTTISLTGEQVDRQRLTETAGLKRAGEAQR